MARSAGYLKGKRLGQTMRMEKKAEKRKQQRFEDEQEEMAFRKQFRDDPEAVKEERAAEREQRALRRGEEKKEFGRRDVKAERVGKEFERKQQLWKREDDDYDRKVKENEENRKRQKEIFDVNMKVMRDKITDADRVRRIKEKSDWAKLQEEGTTDFIADVYSGKALGDKQAALKKFNKVGRYKDVVDYERTDKGLVIKHKDGSIETIDNEQIVATLDYNKRNAAEKFKKDMTERVQKLKEQEFKLSVGKASSRELNEMRKRIAAVRNDHSRRINELVKELNVEGISDEAKLRITNEIGYHEKMREKLDEPIAKGESEADKGNSKKNPIIAKSKEELLKIKLGKRKGVWVEIKDEKTGNKRIIWWPGPGNKR